MCVFGAASFTPCLYAILVPILYIFQWRTSAGRRGLLNHASKNPQSRIFEEEGFCQNNRFGGFDRREGEEIVYKHLQGWDVHASTQWRAQSPMSTPPQ